MNETEVQIVGMSRSGNHAIADWIYSQATGRKLLLNCAEGKRNPFDSCRPMACGAGWRAEPEIDFEAERCGRHAPRDLLMHTYEDSWLGHAFSEELSERRDAWLGPSRRRIELVIVRDPFNLFASRLRMGCSLSPKIAVGMWKQHARVVLEGAAVRGAERCAVLYNRWAADPSYRRKVAAFLEVPFSDAGFTRVPEVGGGSSFDGTAYDGRADAMRTAERWCAYVDDPRWRRILDDPALVELSDELFGPIVGDGDSAAGRPFTTSPQRPHAARGGSGSVRNVSPAARARSA